MSPGLGKHSVTRVNQDNRKVGRGGAGDHITRVLLMPGGISDDKATPGSGEVPVGHINRNALLSLGLEPVGEESEVQFFPASRTRILAKRGQMVFVKVFGIVQQTPN